MITLDISRHNREKKDKVVPCYDRYAVDDSIAVLAYILESEDPSEIGDFYGDLTRNISASEGNFIALDANNAPNLVKEFLRKKSYYVEEEPTYYPSGFCMYPCVTLSDKFFKECDTYDSLEKFFETKISKEG